MVDSIRAFSGDHPQTVLSVGILAVGSVWDVPSVLVLRHSGVLMKGIGLGIGKRVSETEARAGIARRKKEGCREFDGEHGSASRPPCLQLSFLQPVSRKSYKWVSRWRILAGEEFPGFLPERLRSRGISFESRTHGDNDHCPDEEELQIACQTSACAMFRQERMGTERPAESLPFRHSRARGNPVSTHRDL